MSISKDTINIVPYQCKQELVPYPLTSDSYIGYKTHATEYRSKQELRRLDDHGHFKTVCISFERRALYNIEKYRNSKTKIYIFFTLLNDTL